MLAFISELPTILWWYLLFFVIGMVFMPFTNRVFSVFNDKGYAFSKILGIALLGYSVWILGSLKIAPFSLLTILGVLVFWIIINLFLSSKLHVTRFKLQEHKPLLTIILIEEALFFFGYLIWVYVRGHEPSIHGLEKFMDFGFINTILNTSYFPPQDMWLAPEVNSGTYTGGFFINYYYFGHYITAFLTKLSALSSAITYNLMLSSLFGLTFSATFSLGYNLIYKTAKKISSSIALVGGLISGFLLTVGGNLHTLYIFTRGYPNESPIPFWQILGSAVQNGSGQFYTAYWYPNATRFIPNTIHEFPSYSWVVADLHGHVLDIPFVLLTLAVLLSLLLNSTLKTMVQKAHLPILLGLLTAIMYMTNAWDGLIYFGVTILVIFAIFIKNKRQALINFLFSVALILFSYFVFSLPFNQHFVPFVHGIGVVGGYEFIQHLGLGNLVKSAVDENGATNPQVLTFGPFIFEKGNNLSSPLWMLVVLWGFFYSTVILIIQYFINSYNILSNSTITIADRKIPIAQSLFILMVIFAGIAVFFELVSIASVQNTTYATTVSPIAMFWAFLFVLVLILVALFIVLKTSSISPVTAFMAILIIVATGLITVPELFYAKDIYPGHYRANTMFKLGYQAFMMLSLVSGYAIVMTKKYVSYWKQKKPLLSKLFSIAVIGNVIFFIVVMLYPYFSINSYYGVFKPVKTGGRTYETINGTAWLAQLHPDDLAAIKWFREQVKNKHCNKGIENLCVIVEGVGDSYTDYARISVHTGFPTVLGWPVHEWLWRGSYAEPGTRVEEVRMFYETTNEYQARAFLETFDVNYIIIGSLERDKYPNINEQVLSSLANKVFESGSTAVYEVKK